MKTKTHQKFLQKPKRIRKHKRDFLRGVTPPIPPPISYQRSFIPLPYIILFALLAFTIISYTSLSFLFGRIHINTASFSNAVAHQVAAIKLPHVVLHISMPQIPAPNINVYFPYSSLQIAVYTQIQHFASGLFPKWSMSGIQMHLKLPTVALPTQALLAFFIRAIDLTKQSSMFLLQQNLLQMIPFLFSAFQAITSIALNVLRTEAATVVPQVSNFFRTFYNISTYHLSLVNFQLFTVITQSLSQTIPTVLKNAIHILNPFPQLQILRQDMDMFFSAITNIVVFTFVWLSSTFADYLSALRNILGTSLVSGFEILSALGNLLLQGVFTAYTYIVFVTWQHVSLLLQSLQICVMVVMQALTTFALMIVQLLRTGITLITIGVKQVFLGVTYIIAFIAQGIMYAIHGIISFVIAIVTSFVDWVISIILAIKRFFDAIVGAIGAFIHLGDPLYAVIGQTIAAIFITTGQTLTFIASMIRGGSKY